MIGNEVIRYKVNNTLYVESFEKMWKRLVFNNLTASIVGKEQGKEYEYIDAASLGHDIEIYDAEKGFVKVERLIRKFSDDWMKVTMDGRVLTCTSEQSFRSRHDKAIKAKKLKFGKENYRFGDIISYSNLSYREHFEGDDDSEIERATYFLGYALTNAVPVYDKLKLNLDGGCDRIMMANSYEEFFNTEYYGSDYQTIKYDHHSNNIVLVELKKEGVDRLMKLFGSEDVSKRAIPQEVIRSSYGSRDDFFDGLIDASATIYDVSHEWGEFYNRQYAEFKLDSKELALQMLELRHMDGDEEAYYYEEEINGQTKYCLFFMIPYVTYKSAENYGKTIIRGDNANGVVKSVFEEGYVTDVEQLYIEDYGYSVITASGYFNASGVCLCDYSAENC